MVEDEHRQATHGAKIVQKTKYLTMSYRWDFQNVLLYVTSESTRSRTLTYTPLTLLSVCFYTPPVQQKRRRSCQFQ